MAACCEDPQNLTFENDTLRPEVRVKRCVVCGRRHYTLKADQGKLGLRLSPASLPRGEAVDEP